MVFMSSLHAIGFKNNKKKAMVCFVEDHPPLSCLSPIAASKHNDLDIKQGHKNGHRAQKCVKMIYLIWTYEEHIGKI